MNVILHMAISLNGMISRENDDTDFLSHDNWVIFVELAQEFGALVWGRKTHEIVRSYGTQYLDDLRTAAKVVVTTNPTFPPEPGWEIAGSPEEALHILEAQGKNDVLLVGGARLNSAFALQGLIDAVILNVEPVMIATGIPVFTPEHFDLKLRLNEVRHVRENLLQLRYTVAR